MRFLFRRPTDTKPKPKPLEPAGRVSVDALLAEGNALEDRGEVASAFALYQRAVDAAPDSWRAWLNLGNAHRGLGQFADAASAYREAIEIEGKSAAAHQNLGSVLLEIGDMASAAAAFREALRFKPDAVEAWIGLGTALEPSAPAEAIAAYEKAQTLAPNHPATGAMLARLYLGKGDEQAAMRTLDAMLRRDPRNVAALRARGDIEKDLGHGAAAASAYREAVAIDPNPGAWSAYLFALNLDETADAAAILAEHVRFGSTLAMRVPRMHRREARDPRRMLRVGYVSPDFRRHSVACFIEPLLRHHDRSAIEVHCYYNHATSDEITERFIGLSDRWHVIASLDDATVAKQIADDGIDILVDLAGHTQGGRLGVFARKPSPLQFTWLGYLCTTGVDAIDYRICDAQTDPPGIAERWQVEGPARVPDSQWCYQPQATLTAPSSLPFLGCGHWTFGSFNQVSKLNPSLLARWAMLLTEIPNSHLRLFGVTSPAFEANTRAIFEAHGIARSRVDFVGRLPIDRYFLAYADVDIALDTSPYNGATTTCDALIMGVPVLAVAGDRAVSRSGVSLLRAIGLDDWIAPSTDALTATVRRQLDDVEALARLRASLPERMRASALMDGARFTRGIETIYRNTWTERCTHTASR
jgi:protein O-GlcNAc transferase